MDRPVWLQLRVSRWPAVLVALATLTSTTCSNGNVEIETTSPVIAPTASEGPIPDVDLFEQPVVDAPDPADRAGAAADHIDCRNEIWQGGWSSDFGPPYGAADPDGAIVAFVDDRIFSLPSEGFTGASRLGGVEGWE